MLIQITDEGKQNLYGMPALKRHVLTVLMRGDTNILALTKTIRNEYLEYKNIDKRIFVMHITDLIKLNMVKYG